MCLFDPILFLFRIMNFLPGTDAHFLYVMLYLSGVTFNNSEENKDTEKTLKFTVVNTATARFTVCGCQDELVVSGAY